MQKIFNELKAEYGRTHTWILIIYIMNKLGLISNCVFSMFAFMKVCLLDHIRRGFICFNIILIKLFGFDLLTLLRNFVSLLVLPTDETFEIDKLD